MLYFRRWKAERLEPHPTEKAIVVNYKLEAAVYGGDGNGALDPMLEDKRVSSCF